MTDNSPGEARRPLPGGDTHFPVNELVALVRRGISGLYLLFRAGLAVVQVEQTAALVVEAAMVKKSAEGSLGNRGQVDKSGSQLEGSNRDTLVLWMQFSSRPDTIEDGHSRNAPSTHSGVKKSVSCEETPDRGREVPDRAPGEIPDRGRQVPDRASEEFPDRGREADRGREVPDRAPEEIPDRGREVHDRASEVLRDKANFRAQLPAQRGETREPFSVRVGADTGAAGAAGQRRSQFGAFLSYKVTGRCLGQAGLRRRVVKQRSIFCRAVTRRCGGFFRFWRAESGQGAVSNRCTVRPISSTWW